MAKNKKTAIGSFIKEQRELKKIKAKYVADQIGISHTYFSLVEHEVKQPSIKILRKIARVFKYDLEDFIIEYLVQHRNYSKPFLQKSRPLIKDLLLFS